VASLKPRPEGDRGGGEDATVARIADALRRATGTAPVGELWLGDDAAVVGAPDGPLVLSTDAVVEGVHADLSLVTLDDLGWKALTAAVSDIGAMGARPLHALVAICAPEGTDVGALVEGLAEGSPARGAGTTAMIDVSDGLALDLHRLADASGVGFVLDAVPVAQGASLDEALGGGEDYELVVATPDPGALESAFAGAGLRPPLVLGRCTKEVGERLLDGEPLDRLGYEHAVG
jgi:thiamine monophosphate kinase